MKLSDSEVIELLYEQCPKCNMKLNYSISQIKNISSLDFRDNVESILTILCHHCDNKMELIIKEKLYSWEDYEIE